jgi:glycosyltransferase involved in cell wall biosynthesis
MNKVITYVYLSGRKERLKQDFKDAEEFFYSYLYFKRQGFNTEVIEFSHSDNYINSLLKFIDKILRKITKLPFFMSDILITRNIKQLLRSDNVVLTSDRIACSILPLLVVNSIRKRKTDYTCVVLGLFQHKNVKGLRKILQKLLINSILKNCDHFIFLGKGEFDYATVEYPKYEEKFNFVPFCIDTNFWKIDSDTPKNKKGVLFVGNDGNRLYDLVLKIAAELPNIDFKLVTSNIEKNQISTDNVKLINGHWQSNKISDTELRNYYQESKITIIPLKNTLQPSGQSVALQSMANGTPVLISKTDGFWSYKDFLNNENIFFIEENNIQTWKENIEKLYNNKELLNKVKLNAIKTINNNFHLDIFHQQLEKIMGIKK